MDYKSSGVDVEYAESSLSDLKPLFKETNLGARLGNVVEGIGGFSGIFKGRPEYQNAHLVAATDGVGTKLALCQRFAYLDKIGFDLVAMCVNDLYCSGGVPAFFLDYFSCGKLNKKAYSKILKSISEACSLTGMALLGGETAEHPGIMEETQIDLAGFCVGFVFPEKRLPKLSLIQEGDIITALPSSGLHSNGFSLVRALLKKLEDEKNEELNLLLNDQNWIQNTLLKPTRIYTELTKLSESADIKAVSHITGGGIYQNLARVLPEEYIAVLEQSKSPLPVYQWLKKHIEINELYKTFNMGWGMVFIADRKNTELLKEVSGEIEMIGEVEEQKNPPSPEANNSQRVFIRGIGA